MIEIKNVGPYFVKGLNTAKYCTKSMLPGGRRIGGPLPGGSTSVTGSPSGLDPSTEEDEAALMDD